MLTDAAYDNDAAATTGTVSYTSPVLTWTGALAPGGTATITYTVTVNNPDTGDKHLVNTVTSATQGSTCPPGGTDPACTATVTDLIPALTITKTATVATTSPGSSRRLHDHRRRHRPDPLHPGDRHRSPVRRPGRRRLQRRRHRHRRAPSATPARC